MLRPAVLFAASLLLALTVPAGAQEHEHTDATGVVLAHDVPPTGRTYVGNLNHFAILDLGLQADMKTADTVPDFHQQNHARVTWNGLVLYETTPDSGHDYDGIHAFDIAFPGPGTYAVEALSETGAVLAHFNGTVVGPKPGPAATIDLSLDEADTGVRILEPTAFTYRIEANGTLVPHSDAYFEVLQGGAVLFRAKTHTHEDPQQVSYAFPAAGEYVVRVVAFLSYPSGKEAYDFQPVVAQKTVLVGIGNVDPVTPATATPPADQNAIAAGTTAGGAYELVGTYDPYTQVGTGTLQHLTALVMDPATKAPLQHVDFEATLTGPTGVVFHSATLHEYDGMLELAVAMPVPGVYELVATASYDDWTGTVRMPYVVVPPVVPVGLDVPPAPPAAAGIVLGATGIDAPVSGTPLDVVLSAVGPGGQAVPHSEIDVQLLDAHGVPLLMTKLHTHSDGLFPFRFTLPAPGDYTLRLTPFPLDPQASVSPYALAVDNLGSVVDVPTLLPGAVDLPIHAMAGPGLPAEVAQDAGPAEDAPAVPAAVTLLALALVVAFLRRR